MSTTKWFINSNQSDFLIRARHSIIAYLASSINKFNGSIVVLNNELVDASIEFILDVNKKEGKLEHIDSHLKLNDLFDAEQHPTVSFKSTSFEKINSDINFLKGQLTVNNITKTVELDAKITQIENQNGFSKVLFEIFGNINRHDFGLFSNFNIENSGLLVGSKISLTANLEFTTNRLN
jgi:polyisoprenoid-binding protein YceI